ncbi:hypothetical protein GGS20DRAFT_559531 [Poronia punctata]|nr:hypothetical protein GGS20DRAFT_559531 [Poronia punctata]
MPRHGRFIHILPLLLSLSGALGLDFYLLRGKLTNILIGLCYLPLTRIWFVDLGTRV